MLRSSSKTNLFLNGVLTAAQHNGYSILLYDSAEDISRELKNITSLCKNRVDGVIWEPVTCQSLEHERHFKEQEIEVCCINQPEIPSAFSIDYAEIGYAATDFLIRYGHTKPGCLTKQNSIRSRLVCAGFKKCLFDNGISFHDSMELPAETDDWYNGILSHTPTGIVSTHYADSLALMEHLTKIRFRMPYDLSLISLRDDASENTAYSGISTIKIPYYEFGLFVCQRLIEKCEKKNLPHRPQLPSSP